MPAEKKVCSLQRKRIRPYCLSPLFFILVLLAAFGCQQHVEQKTPLLAPPPSGAELFKSKCSKCHDPERALQQYRSADVWEDTILRMKKEHHAEISPVEIEALVQYHVERQKYEAAIFREKCEKCHPGKVFLEKNLTPEQTRAIIKRMQQKAGNTIEDEDVEIIVRYHVQFHQAALEEEIKNVFARARHEKPAPKKSASMQRGMALFAQKCSTCHELERALSVIKDPDVWGRTIKRMQSYSKGAISDEEAQELTDFHVKEQQREINAFRETCTKCHDDKRINSRSMSEDQWIATIKRMQAKAPELISDEKINLIAAYFHRRELTMARIFYGKCRFCHADSKGKSFQASTGQVGGVIVLGSEEFGESFRIKDVNALTAFHVERERRDMRLYETKCSVCHPDGIPEKKAPGRKDAGGRSRAEWITFIATLKGQELDKDIQITINSEIDYHVSRH